MTKRRVLRGGSFDDGSWSLRSSVRRRRVPEGRYCDYGFRIVISRRHNQRKHNKGG